MKWLWQVTCRYNEHATWPRQPGALAIQTRHADDVSKDMELQAAARRGDVTVEVVRLAD